MQRKYLINTNTSKLQVNITLDLTRYQLCEYNTIRENENKNYLSHPIFNYISFSFNLCSIAESFEFHRFLL